MKKKFILLFIICSFFIQCKNKEVFYTYELISMKNDKGIIGRFAFGGGHIEEKLYYIAYIKTDKGIQKIKINAEMTTIILDDEEEPNIKIYVLVGLKGYCGYEGEVNKFNENPAFWINQLNKGFGRYIIVIPKDSIISEININL